MQNWDLKAIEGEPHQPRILASADDARTIVLLLPAGEELQEHEVHERARLAVIEGEVEVTTLAGERATASAGHLFEFDPGERHTVAARSDARLLLILTPWPGDGHPGALTLEQKADVRERAARHP
ncbi:MAG TPA: cupin domain-containing protein [Solirubrobacterales bacterium]|nr:cupin domain-containing protein [Solirubrobacterales bacterium]